MGEKGGEDGDRTGREEGVVRDVEGEEGGVVREAG